jgi:exo-beta-1,3-glucanase (GH17 family)
MGNNRVFRKDVSQTNLLVKVGKVSGRNAIRMSKAMDLVVTYIEKGVVYEEQPDGTKNQIDFVEINPSKISLKKGMILRGK